MAFNSYNYGGYPAGYYVPPPMPDNLAQLRGAQMPVQPLQTPQQFGAGQMLQNQQQLSQQAMTGPIYVNGEAGAKGYIIAPNQTVMLIDADPDANTFWLKSADAAGMPSMRTFDYTERLTPQKPVQTAIDSQVEYVTKKDFDALSARADELAHELETLKSRKCACSKKSAVKEDEAVE